MNDIERWNGGIGNMEVGDFRAQDFPTRSAHRGDDYTAS